MEASPCVGCLGEHTIAAFVTGQLEFTRLRRLEAHVSDCTACRSVLFAAARALAESGELSPDTWRAESAVARVGMLEPTPQIGELLAGKYQIEEQIGRGGMGVVLAARHVQLGHRVAIKVLHQSGQDAADRFLREGQICARLASDHIPRVFDLGRLANGSPYLVMEHLVGEDLARLCERRPLELSEALEYVRQACDGLAEAHAAGVVHRDLKPANLFLTQRSDGTPLVKLLDFGVSKLLVDGGKPAQALTLGRMILGTPLYMSPEQIRASDAVDARTDIWSLGVILYQLLTGHSPFTGANLAALAVAIATQSPRAPSTFRADLPPGLEALVLRCLEKDPALRFPTPTALLVGLRAPRAERTGLGESKPREASPRHLPIPPTPLVGRGQALRALCDDVRGGQRLLTLIGPPGVGKTRLALEAASLLADEFEAGAHFVELAPVTTPADIPIAVARVLGVTDAKQSSSGDALVEYLAPRRCLLVLDNFEHVIEGAPLVAGWLSACASLSVLATSRVPLELRAERQVAVDPLTLAPQGEELLTLQRAEAVQLFVARARAVRAEFVLTRDNAASIAELCARLDGLPLAIELVAARSRTFTPAELLERLAQGRDALGKGPRDAPERHRTLKSAIAWSYDRLPGEAQRVFDHLAVFSGGCSAQAVQAVLGEDLDTPAWLELLQQSSLVQANVVAGETRHSVLETIREFGLERLTLRGAQAAARERHARYFERLAETAQRELLGADQARFGLRLAAELDNVRAALRWAAAAGQTERSLRISSGVWRFFWQRGLLREGVRWFEPALAAAGGAPAELRARALRAAGVLACGLSDYARALGWMEASVVAAQQAGDAAGVAAGTSNLGMIYRDQGEWERATHTFTRAIELNRGPEQQPHSVKFPMVMLAGLYLRLGEPEKAEPLYVECLSHNRALGDTEGTANSLWGLAVTARSRGDWAAARERGEQALELYAGLQHQYGMAFVHQHLANAARDADQPDEALAHYRQCLALWRERGDPVGAALALEDAGCWLARRGAWSRVSVVLGAAAQLRERASALLTPHEAERHRQLLDQSRSRLGSGVFERRWQEGLALSLEQAIEVATAPERAVTVA